MKQVLDLHIHSRYSRACSAALTLPNIDKACRTKGIDIIATGDFTHPAWFSDIENQLEEIGSTGLLKLKSADNENVRFILSTELSLVYKDGGKARRIHLVLHAPNLEAVRELDDHLGKKYNIKSDGRPILGISAPELIKLCLSINPKFLVYPAHIWTPWFSVFGSKSGFDSMEECFYEQTENIYAYETGLSSDPEMNWRVSALDKLTLLSNSDAHSTQNLAREANVFELTEFTYDEIYETIKTKDLSKIKYSIEFYPEEGMYHYDGHRACGVRMRAPETRKNHGICPVCKKPLTVGVEYRVEELADREMGVRPDGMADFIKLVELDKIIAEAIGVKNRSAKKVRQIYDEMISAIGPELQILVDAPIEEIKKHSLPRVAEGIRRVRAGELTINPGFDGEYGEVRIFGEKEEKQRKLI